MNHIKKSEWIKKVKLILYVHNSEKIRYYYIYIQCINNNKIINFTTFNNAKKRIVIQKLIKIRITEV